MKSNLIILYCLVSGSFCFAQAPTQSPDEGDLLGKGRSLGSSLEEYKRREIKRKDRTGSRGANGEVASTDSETIAIDTKLVVNDILVTDQKGNIVRDLNKEDFVVTEDGVQQSIELFSLGETTVVPRSIVLIIDCNSAQAAYFKNSIQAAKRLVDRLGPSDKMAIVTSKVKIARDFTTDKALLKRTLDQLESDAGSGLEFDSLLAVLNEMFGPADRRRIVIFQGDANEVIWLRPDKGAPYVIKPWVRDQSGMTYSDSHTIRDFGFNDIKAAIETSQVTIYSIVPGIKFFGLSKKERSARARRSFEKTYQALGLPARHSATLTKMLQNREVELQTAGQTAMYELAELSGGSLSFVEKPEDAEEVYSRVFALMGNRYVIGYYPGNSGPDGARRVVSIKVPTHPEYVITGCKTYVQR